jgi:hypothetical protein
VGTNADGGKSAISARCCARDFADAGGRMGLVGMLAGPNGFNQQIHYTLSPRGRGAGNRPFFLASHDLVRGLAIGRFKATS